MKWDVKDWPHGGKCYQYYKPNMLIRPCRTSGRGKRFRVRTWSLYLGHYGELAHGKKFHTCRIIAEMIVHG